VPLTISTDVPNEATRTAIRTLADRIERSEGAPPLSDQTRTQVASAGVEHFVARDGGELVGYAQLADSTLELAAVPDAVSPLLDRSAATAGVTIWTHGRRSSLVPALEERRFERVRELHQLRRPLDAGHPLPADPPLADGVEIRPLVPGRDNRAWLALNAAAFAHHPEQGRWTEADLQARIDEPWFEAAGFLLAERAGELLGFHWTKIHSDGAGEVYVLGVAPTAQGLGLGNALLVRGLRHLADHGCPVVLLYVDADNASALRLYERAGFARHDLDIQWQVPVRSAAG
jgi:mycothiol synthase